MSKGRKSISSSITDNWEKAFFNSIGHYITLINKGLSKNLKSEPLSKHIKIIGGFAFKNSEYKSSGVPIIRISDFNNERIVLDNVVYYEESPLFEKYELKESDIIIALTGGTIGKLGIVQAGLGKLYLNQRVGKFHILNPDEFEKEYIYWIARGVQGIVKNLAWGAAIPNVSPKQIEELKFPIPSKAIQKNIIRFLNDLRERNVNNEIYFDEEIEKQIKDIQEKQVKAREIQDELSHQLTLLDQLNQAILQEAVQGKLVPQDPNDEPASELLKRILALSLSKGKPKKPLPPIKPEEIPFEIPENWVWCRLGEIGESTIGIIFKPSQVGKIGIPVLRANNIQNGKIDYADLILVNTEVREKQIANIGDILLCVRSGSNNLIGKAAMVEKEGMSFGAFMSLYRSEFNPYILKFMHSDIFKKQINDKKSTGINQLTQGTLNNIIIPLPPLSEQKRIVAEIERQFAKTKQLKEHILANQAATEQLLKALLHQAFEVKENEEHLAKA
jgi:type I restriction enzyme S subunit